jgi:hypothetical protein
MYQWLRAQTRRPAVGREAARTSSPCVAWVQVVPGLEFFRKCCHLVSGALVSGSLMSDPVSVKDQP